MHFLPDTGVIMLTKYLDDRSSGTIICKDSDRFCINEHNLPQKVVWLKEKLQTGLETVGSNIPDCVYDLWICDFDGVEICPLCKVDFSLAENGKILTGGLEGDVCGCRTKNQFASSHRWRDVGNPERSEFEKFYVGQQCQE
jgi:hypothetical protein